MNEEFEKLLIKKYPGQKQESLMDMLLDIQAKFGYLSKDSISFLSNYLLIPESRIFSITSMYTEFRYKNPGKFYIRICRGTNCHIFRSAELLNAAAAALKIRPGQTTRDGLFTLDVVTCLGACSKSPVVSVNGEFLNSVSVDGLLEIISELRAEHKINDKVK